MNSIIRNSICGNLLEKVISESYNDTLCFGESKDDIFLARGGCSDSLSNSPHCDVNDASPSFAAFFRESGNKDGLTWIFLFPSISLAIELSNRPCVISWDGRVEPHCSRAVSRGILSGGSWRNRSVQQHSVSKHAFECHAISHNKNLEECEKVRVRKRLKGKRKQWCNINAKVVRLLEKNNVIVQFSNGNTEVVDREDVVKFSIVNKLIKK